MKHINTVYDHSLIKSMLHTSGLDAIYQKVMDHERLSFEDGVQLFETRDLTSVGYMANIVRERMHGARSFFVRNRQLNPTNVCEYSCMFCSFYRREGEEGGYTMTMEQIAQRVKDGLKQGIQEIHITSGLHPGLPFSYYTDMLSTIKSVAPHIHIKGFTAVEIEYYANHYNMSMRAVLEALMKAGLEAMPGGGAEIFAQRVREKICDEKATAEGWFKVHGMAHELGLMTNATMLYGHIERYDERIDHLIRLRELQDDSLAKKTKGSFSTFIPLKYQHENNRLKKLPQVSAFEDLKVVAVSRLMLDNFPNIKAYWVVIGKNMAQTALSYGANEIEGTILEETIMSMAGTDSASGMTTSELIKLISDAGRQPIERDALYNVIKEFSTEDIAHAHRNPVMLPVLN
ncbi:MAG TPA: aminofutalosine synthase MqnE [bacterium]|nr:aminofutalosine synthase MqnE [bacterium]